MEIHRIGPFPDLPLNSASAEGETAVKGARRGEASPKAEDPAPAAENESPGQPAESLQEESRQSAESLKARLLARCDQAGTAAHGPAAGVESSPIADVTDYLLRHPEAEDSLEGIDGWREFGEMAELDARGDAVAMDRIVLQAEGWVRDEGTAESSGSTRETDGENSADDPDRG